ncbi:hypothetical protein Lser_V15G44038 [Lactuca serriola]
MMCSNVGNSFSKTRMVASPYELLILLDELGSNNQNTFTHHAQMLPNSPISRVSVILKHELVEDG